MALDGIVIANIVSDMQVLNGARISKIAQPEPDELLITFATNAAGAKRMLISAGASLPLIYFTEQNKPSPATAPGFCMLLRKHIGGGRVKAVSQDGLERIIRIDIEHLDEMGDLSTKRLIIELMGKHSNIIFTDEAGKIIDSIKRIPASVSSLREVLPGREYFVPESLKKLDTLSAGKEDFIKLLSGDTPAAKALYSSLSGISPISAEEICHRAGLDGDMPAGEMAEALYEAFDAFRADIISGCFSPEITYKDDIPLEFSSERLSIYDGLKKVTFDDASSMLESYYAQKEIYTRIRQRSSDLRRITDTALERVSKKLSLQEQQLNDTKKRDKYKLYGELLRAYAYSLKDGESSVTVQDYNNDYKDVTIALDPLKTISENATRFYERYQKLRRTALALDELIGETSAALTQLQEIQTSLLLAQSEEDLSQIKAELIEAGYIKKSAGGASGKGGVGSGKSPGKGGGAKSSSVKISKSEPLHFVSSDGYDIYVGKNNYQNEYVTFTLAEPNDWWFHAKGRPGSHVIVKSGITELDPVRAQHLAEDLPDRLFEEAGAIAASYCGAGKGEKIDIDYTLKKNIKKPANGRPGLVIYHTNYSLVAPAAMPDLKA